MTARLWHFSDTDVVKDLSFFDGLKESILVVDQELKVHHGNPAVAELFGVSVRRLASGRHIEVLSHFLPNPFAALASVHQLSQSVEANFRTDDGSDCWVRVTLQPLPGIFAVGESPRWLISMHDVTLRRVEEEKLFVDKILRLAQNRIPFRIFLKDVRHKLAVFGASAYKNAGELQDVKEFQDLRRDLHTIKGAATSLALQGLAQACHRIEDEIANQPSEVRKILAQKSLELEKILDDEVARLAEVFGRIEDGHEERNVELPLSTLLGWSLRLLSVQRVDEAREIGHVIRRESLEKPVGASSDTSKSLCGNSRPVGKSNWPISPSRAAKPVSPSNRCGRPGQLTSASCKLSF